MHVLTKRHLPRRTMLKGMGAAIALPFMLSLFAGRIKEKIEQEGPKLLK